MKKAKLITAAALMIAALVVTGEVYVWHVGSFAYTGYANMTMYLQAGDTWESMRGGILKAARDTGVGVFCMDKKVDGIFSERVYIYATDLARAELSEKSRIREGTFESLFLGSTSVRLLPFEEAPDVSSFLDENTYYVTGPEEQILNFRRATINEYAGRFPNEFPGGRDTEKIYVAAVWAAVAALILLLTQFEIELLKKESVIRLLGGESLGGIAVRNMLCDAVVISVLLAGLTAALGGFTNTLYAPEVTAISAGALLLLNSASYLRLLFVNYRRDLSTKKGAEGTLRAAYAFKIASIIIAALALAGNIEMISDALEYRRQRGFFDARGDYSFIMIFNGVSNHDEERSREVNIEFYSRLAERGDALSIVRHGSGNYVSANDNAIAYLIEEIPELGEREFEKKLYIAAPEKIARDERAVAAALAVWAYGAPFEYEVIGYKTHTEIIAMDNVGSAVRPVSAIMENPVILLNNMGAESLNSVFNWGFITQSTLFRVTDAEFRAYLDELSEAGYGMERSYTTNARENYMFRWELEKRTILIATVLTALVLALEAIVIRTILRFEYSVYSTELALKKVLGHTFFSRHRRIILTTAILGGASLAGALALGAALGSSSLANIAVGGIILLALEFAFISWNAARIERRNIQRILKGEAV
ncbi:MAG: hypothetical protein LBK23_06765 [Oscillospiraceae bacterium]|jgi:hypothetical protein|nr:hypothetical protein [Oscillospiraceae bacterium]